MSTKWRRGCVMQKFLNFPPKQAYKRNIHRANWPTPVPQQQQEAVEGISQTFQRWDKSLSIISWLSLVGGKLVKNILKENRFLYLTKPDNINMQVQGNG